MKKTLQLFQRHRLILGDLLQRLRADLDGSSSELSQAEVSALWQETRHRLHACASLWFALCEPLSADAIASLRDKEGVDEKEHLELLNRATGAHS